MGPTFQCFYPNFPVVKQRNHCIFPLSNKTISYVHREIQVLLNGTTGNPKNASQGVFNSESLGHMTGISY